MYKFSQLFIFLSYDKTEIYKILDERKMNIEIDSNCE